MPDGEWLGCGSGVYVPRNSSERTQSHRRFRFGEGLPGAAWATRRALLWKDLGAQSTHARLAPSNIDAALALPLFRGDNLVAVVTLLFTSHVNKPCCVEVWEVNDTLDVLTHESGLYCRATEFERLSRLLQFPRGTGLPGTVWASGDCETLDDVALSSAFVRSDLAERSGLRFGVGLPLKYNRHVTQVLTLLCSRSNPFVAACEVFKPSPRVLKSVLRVDACNEESGTAAKPLFDSLANGVAAHGVPTVGSDETSIQLALPIAQGGELASVACLAFR